MPLASVEDNIESLVNCSYWTYPVLFVREFYLGGAEFLKS